MPRRKREACESSIYHIVQRGAGQQILFEDDADRSYFLRILKKYATSHDGEILAWCLMSNHTHLLIKMDMDRLSLAMKSIGISYARYFNDRHARSGHLFQDRFHSESIADDAQLMVTVRYIHANPLKAGATDCLAFPWSSYTSYIGLVKSDLVETELVLGIFGGIEQFERFHMDAGTEDKCLDIQPSATNTKLTEEQALRTAQRVLGPEMIFRVKSLPKKERDAALRQLRNEGLGTRQIMRITGVSLGVISRA